VKREGFLLSKHWRDTSDGLRLELWISSNPQPLHVTLTDQKAIFFVDRDTITRAGQRKAVALASMQNRPVDAVYFHTQRELLAERGRLAAAGQRVYEADVKPVERTLMERFILGGVEVTGPAILRSGVLHLENPRLKRNDSTPDLLVMSIDIETSGLDGPLLSIAGTTGEHERVFLVADPATAEAGLPATVTCHPNAAAVLDAFFNWVAERNPDLIIGWSVVEFDLLYLANLCQQLGKKFELGRGRSHAEVLTPRSEGQPHVARIPGRVVLDGIATLKSATYQFESFALDDVAQQLLGRGKKIRATADPVAEIQRMAAEDPAALAEYNLEDCRLVLEVFRAAKLIEFAVERQRLTGLTMDRQGGSVAAFDQLYLPRLHRAGFVAPTVLDRRLAHSSPGGLVMESRPGLYRNVLVLDFKSLYPSIIRTFLIDPLGLACAPRVGADESVQGFDGARFVREGHILPQLIRNLWAARDEAKREQNQALSQAIKIIMNSFYGILGTPGCRFFDPRLVSSITLRGHEILARSRAFIEERGHAVIYGDTDSLFVHLSEELDAPACNRIGAQLARDLTRFFQESLERELGLTSCLELEFETHFSRFLMPTVRGSEMGSKKRYAGMVLSEAGKESLVFKGLEVVRTDWTAAARNFQKELVRRVFADEPVESFVRDTAQRLSAGLLDDQLVYRKRLRRTIGDYTHNVPQHVQAARQLERPGRFIHYVLTSRGPEPVELRKSPLDYRHYLERQLAPAADTILHFLGTTFERITGAQLDLFS
jgi:DNA polymerase-2